VIGHGHMLSSNRLDANGFGRFRPLGRPSILIHNRQNGRSSAKRGRMPATKSENVLKSIV